MTAPARTAKFILDNTSLVCPPHAPEIRLHLASESHALWLKTEEELEEIGLPPPFWAFAWAGGQGLARWLLDNPQSVRGKRVLDLATGSGLVAIAAAKCGATRVTANDIDPWCEAAVQLNADANSVTLDFDGRDLAGTGMQEDWQIILAGDVFYSKDMVESLVQWFDKALSLGCDIIVGDPGRAYLPRERLSELASYQVAVTRDLEDSEVKKTTVWRFNS